MMERIYYIDTEGWVSEAWLMWNYIKSTDQIKQYELLKKAITTKTDNIKEGK